MPLAPSDHPPIPPLPTPPKARSWVESVEGKPRIRWFLMMPVVAVLAVQVLVSMLFSPTGPELPPGKRLPFVNLLFAYELVLVAGAIVVYVELQRQKILSGKSKWQIGLGATMLLTALAAILCALLGHEFRAYRSDQDKFRANQQKIADMTSIVTGGNPNATLTVMDPTLDGSKLACYVQRATFSKDDLTRLIDVATEDGKVPCPIESLALSLSAVDEEALRDALARMPQLRELAYFRYPIQDGGLDDETLDAIIQHCPKLRGLRWNFQEFSPEQLERLRYHFPDLQVNGQSWDRFLKQKR